MKKIVCLLTLLFSQQIMAATSQNVVLITIDGLRWQEVFAGADARLMNDSRYVFDQEMTHSTFWSEDPLERRRKLMPFMWDKLIPAGQIVGNRDFGCKMNASNTLWFSYPGYNELLVGYPDDERITSNDPLNNPNVTVLEKLNRLPDFNGRVAASSHWDVMAPLVNEQRSGIPVMTAPKDLFGQLAISLKSAFTDLGMSFSNLFEHGSLSAGNFFSGKPWSHMLWRFLEIFTFNNAVNQIDTMHPRVLYVAFGSPDENAHGANYEGYLLSIKQVDSYIERLWNKLQAMPQYKGSTTFIITTDHGRGVMEEWTGHGSQFSGSDQVWAAMIGPDVAAGGEVRQPCQYQLAQIASTVAAVVGEQYSNEKTVAAPLPYSR